jgi:hypothetical protein
VKRPITERQISFVTNVVRTARMEFSSKSVFLLAMETAWDLQEQELDKAIAQEGSASTVGDEHGR